MEIVQEKTKSKISSHVRYIVKKSALHWHYNYEICQVLEHRMQFRVNGVLIDAKAGDLIVIGENMVHQFLATYGDAKVRIMQFSLGILIEAGIPIKHCKIHISAEELERIPGLERQLEMLFDMIEWEGVAGPGENNYFQQCIVAALYCLLTRHFAEESGENLTKEQKEFLGVLEYIGEHFREDINVNILAERLYMYRGRISALFKKYSGMTLNEYLYSLRIKNANELMNRGSSITEAAMDSGFQSVRTFNHVYKKTTGITPTDYKKRSEHTATQFPV